MHLARQKVQMSFFSRKMKYRKEQTNCSFCGESHSSCSQKEFCFSFSDAFGKAKSTNDLLFYKDDIKKGKKIALFVERAILHVVKRNNFLLSFSDAFGKAKSTNVRSFLEFFMYVQKEQFFGPFLMHLEVQKVQMTFFSSKTTLRKEQKNCSFCGESHSSCSQKEQFCCPFLMHLARQKVQMTFFSRKMTFRKEQNNCSFCGESHSSCSQKEQFFCPFLMHLARQKVQMTFFSTKTTLRKEIALFVEQGCSQKNNLLSFSDAFGKAKSTNDVLF